MHVVCKKAKIDFHVLVMSITEENRNWNYEEFSRDYTILLSGKQIKVGSYVLNINKGISKVIDSLNPDFIIAAGSYIHPSIWKLISIKSKYHFCIFFWSESHLNIKRNYGKLKLFIREQIRKRIYQKFDGFIYAGKLSLMFIQKYCRKEAGMIFMPNLVDDCFYSTRVVSNEEKKAIRMNMQISDKEKIFICPARLSNEKGLIPFLKLLAKCEINSDFYLLIVGDGVLKNELQMLIDQNRLPVILVGHKQQNEIRKLYQIADGFILPSIGDSNPLTCIEALWSELPLLLSEHVGNSPEVINESQNGYIFSYNNQQESIEKIIKFIDADEKWIANARDVSLKIAKKNFNSSIEVNRVIKEIANYFNKNLS